MRRKDPVDVTRRKLILQAASVAACSTVVANLPRALAEASSDGPRSAPQTDIPIPRRRAQICALDDVHLEAGPFREAMEHNNAYLLSLDPDRFLHFFRVTAGLPPKADTYGGWEKKVGRMLGHYLSACAMSMRATGNQEFKKRQDYIVDELALCQRAKGGGYVGGVPDADRIFHEIAAGNIYVTKGALNGVHAPWYMLHKMCAGLRDAYAYGGNQQALTVLIGFSDWTWSLTERLSDADMQKMLEAEHGGMNEVFADLFAITMDKKYISLSRRFNHRAVLGPLTRGVDDLDGLHANTQIPTVLGLYTQYEVAGDREAKRGGEFFWETVTQRRSYVIGGNSDREHFFKIGQMGIHLSPSSAETCNSYNMVKLTDHLFSGNPREMLAEYQERVLWNDILASQDKTTPGMTYYMSLAPGHFKTFSTPFDSFWCCVGTGMENHAKYGESLYFSSARELWINQFVASTVTWKERGMQLAQRTSFPHEPRSEWKVLCSEPVDAVINLRHPKWAGDGFTVTINGKQTSKSTPGSYLRLKRTWKNGDVIVASLPLELRVEPMPDDPQWNALLYGPIVLVGLLGTNQMPPTAPYATANQLEFRSAPDPAVPILTTEKSNINDWLKKTGPVQFQTSQTSTGESVQFMPLANVTSERYSVYWKLS